MDVLDSETRIQNGGVINSKYITWMRRVAATGSFTKAEQSISISVTVFANNQCSQSNTKFG